MNVWKPSHIDEKKINTIQEQKGLILLKKRTFTGVRKKCYY